MRLSRVLLWALPVFVCGHAWGQADILRVYSCQGKNVAAHNFYSTSVDAKMAQSLVRKGHAVWVNRKPDQATLEAAVEGRGVWATAPATAVFEMVGSGVDARILAGIAIKESGYKGRYWPWTINFQGKGFYLSDRETAIKAAKYLISQGHTNFDVALMQVNWRWHRQRFSSIEQAFDPATNIRDASEILTEHFRSSGSWSRAIAHYHSKTQSLNAPYLAGVIKHMTALSNPPKLEKSLC